jgi:hypothetical protein
VSDLNPHNNKLLAALPREDYEPAIVGELPASGPGSGRRGLASLLPIERDDLVGVGAMAGLVSAVRAIVQVHYRHAACRPQRIGG